MPDKAREQEMARAIADLLSNLQDRFGRSATV
jgi:hypothetical protein